MSPNIENSKRVGKNTLFLYFRMFLTMAVGLYTSRVVLKTLGVSDYGVYNVVAGFVSMLAYMNSVFVASTQRFFSYTIGLDNKEELKKVFCNAVTVHWIIAILVLIISETFGLWFVNNKLVFEEGRLVAANWVFQFSILSLLINIISVPYNAAMVAHEHMNVYAYVSILEALLKLLIVYLIVVIPGDSLIIYSILTSLVAMAIRVIYSIYCKNHFDECHYQFLWDKDKVKEMSSFAGWTAVGTLGFTFKDQFLNVLLNIFLGTTINAARGIATQVNGIVNQFSSNFFMAVNPQITKQYASGDLIEFRSLVYYSAKYAFYLMTLVVVPILINLEYILQIWLDVVPDYTYEFLFIILISTLIGTISSPSGTAIQATGNIKLFQIGVAGIFILELPLAYIILKNGMDPYWVAVPSILTQLIAVGFRFEVLKRSVPLFSSKYFLLNIVLRPIALFMLCLFPCLFIRKLLVDKLGIFILSSILSIIFSFLIIYFLGLSCDERKTLVSLVKKRIIK